MKKLNIAVLTVLLVFQTLLSPLATYASETDEILPPETGQSSDATNESSGDDGVGEPESDGAINSPISTPQAVTATPPTGGVSVGGPPKPVTPGTDGFNVTDVEIKQDGQSTSDTTFAGTPSELVKSYYLSFKFTLDGGHGVKPGDYYEFTVPTEFSLDPVTDAPIEDQGEVIAKYTVNPDGTVRITFSDAVYDSNSGGQPVNDGSFEMEWKLKQSSLTELGSNEIKFDIAGEKTLDFIVKTPYNGADLVKQNGQHTKNSPTVQWEVTINQRLEGIGGKTLSDSLPATNVVLTPLIPKLVNGDVDLTEEGTPFTTTLPYTFPTVDNNAYKLTYETTVSDSEREEVVTSGGSKLFSNYNTVSLGDFIPAKASVTLSFDTPITKKATAINPTNGTKSLIKWEITVNADGRDISDGVTIEDVLTVNGSSSADGNKMKLDETAQYLPKVDNGGALTYIKDGNNPTFTLNPASGKETEKYTITYYTFDDVVDASYSVSNKATISYDSSVTTKKYTSNVATGNVNVNMFSKSGTDSSNIDYQNKRFNWTINFNGSGYKDLTDVVITDKFESGKYMKMYEADFNDNICTNGATENCFVLTLDQPKNDNDGKGPYTLTGFTLTGQGTINDSKSFKYPTYFDPTQTYTGNYVNNNGTVAWTKGGTVYSNGDTATTNFNTYTGKNGYKAGIYNPIDKTIEWKLDVNYNLHSLTNPKVTDTFKNQQTMKTVTTENVKVYLLKLYDNNQEPEKFTEFTNYTVIGTGTDGTYTGFELQFNETITQPYRIEYTTLYDNKFISDSVVHNKATMTVDGITDPVANLDTEDLKTGVTPTNPNQYMSKDGLDIEKTDYLIWTLKVNASQSYVQAGSTIMDTLNEGQVLVRDQSIIPATAAVKITGDKAALLNQTFFVQKRVYTRSGDIFTPSLETIAAEDVFDIKYEPGDTGFTLTLKNDINEEYEVSYLTDISGADTGTSRPTKVSNTYKYNFEGNGVEQSEQTISKNVTYQRQSASGSLSKYTLELTKLGKDNETLKDVEFGLYVDTNAGLKLLQSVITDADGKANFGEIKYGTFTIKEITPALGYTSKFLVTDKTADYVPEFKFTTAGTTKELAYTLTNQKRDQTVKITNGSACGKPVVDSEFTVYKKDGSGNYQPYKPDGITPLVVKTDSTGKYIFEIDADGKSKQLKPGDYKLEQTDVSDEYDINSTPIEFTIEEDQVTPIDKTINNDCNFCPVFKLTLTDADVGKEVTLKSADDSEISLGKTIAGGVVTYNGSVAHGTYKIYVDGKIYGIVEVDECNETVAKVTSCPNFTLTVGTEAKGQTVVITNTVTNDQITLGKVDVDGKVVYTGATPIPTGDYKVIIDGKVMVQTIEVNGTCTATITFAEGCPVFKLTINTVDTDLDGKKVEVVNVNDSTNTKVELGNLTVTGTTGTVSATALPQGTYKVYVDDELMTEEIVVDSNCQATIEFVKGCPQFTLTINNLPTELVGKKVEVEKDGTTTKISLGNLVGNKVISPQPLESGKYKVYVDGQVMTETILVDDKCEDEITYVKGCPIFKLTITELTTDDIGKEVKLVPVNGIELTVGTVTTDGTETFTFNTVPGGKYKVFIDNVELFGTVDINGDSDCQATVNTVKACPQFTLTVNQHGKNDSVGDGVKVIIKTTTGDTGGVVTEGITDTNGQIIFKDKTKLVEGTKYTVYNSADKELGEITVTYKEGNCQAEVQVLENACPIFTLTIKDVNGNPRVGVDITIKDKTGSTTIGTGTTDANGQITVPYALENGVEYQVYEGVNLLTTITLKDCAAAYQPAPTPTYPWNPTEPINPNPVDPNNPKPVDPNNPKPVDPNNPKPVDPNNPNPVDPNNPKPVDPNNPKPVDPNNPNPEDPNNPNPVDPNNPKPVDPNNPNPEDPNNPNKPDGEDPKPEDPNNPNKPDGENPNPVNPTNPTNPGTTTPPTLPGLEGVIKPIPPSILPTPGKPLTPGELAGLVEKYSKDPSKLDALVNDLKGLVDYYESLSPEQKAEFEELYDVNGLNMMLDELGKVASLQMKLPQTDGASQFGMMLVGSALLLAGAWLFVTRRRKA